MFCRHCGTQQPDGTPFCSQCGQPMYFVPSQQTTGDRRLVGWSTKAQDPEIMAAAAKTKKRTAGCAWIMALLFPVGFLAAGLLMEDMPLNEALIIGIGLGLLMLILGTVTMQKMKKPSWEGIVKNKFERQKRDNDRTGNVETYTEFVLIFQSDAGKKHKLTMKNRHELYDYFEIGDRVKYHPAFSTYEKFDKSNDSKILCNVCSRSNPIQNDRCSFCHNWLFK